MQRKFQTPLYEQRIRTMCSFNLATLDLSYLHLMQTEPTLAIWIVDAPRDMIDVLNEALTRHTLRIFPFYSAIQPKRRYRSSSRSRRRRNCHRRQDSNQNRSS